MDERKEVCRNPLRPDCRGTDIAVYILVKDKKLPICKACWNMLADTDAEWGSKGFKPPSHLVDVEQVALEAVKNVVKNAVKKKNL